MKCQLKHRGEALLLDKTLSQYKGNNRFCRSVHSGHGHNEKNASEVRMNREVLYAVATATACTAVGSIDKVNFLFFISLLGARATWDA